MSWDYAEIYFGFPYRNFCPDIQYVLNTGSASAPITKDQLKLQAKITSGDVENDLLDIYIKTAVRQCENYIRRDLINKSWFAFLDFFPPYRDKGILLLRSKLQSITSIQYKVDGVFQTFSASDYYITNNPAFSSIFLKPEKVWPTDADTNIKQAVLITFVSGYGATAADVPDNIKTGLLEHATFMYQSRGDSADGGFSANMPATVKAIYDSEKIWQL